MHILFLLHIYQTHTPGDPKGGGGLFLCLYTPGDPKEVGGLFLCLHTPVVIPKGSADYSYVLMIQDSKEPETQKTV